MSERHEKAFAQLFDDQSFSENNRNCTIHNVRIYIWNVHKMTTQEKEKRMMWRNNWQRIEQSKFFFAIQNRMFTVLLRSTAHVSLIRFIDQRLNRWQKEWLLCYSNDISSLCKWKTKNIAHWQPLIAQVKTVHLKVARFSIQFNMILSKRLFTKTSFKLIINCS